MSATRNKFSPEFRDRAVRIVEEHRGDYPSEWAAMSSIAAKVGCTTETLRRWCREEASRFKPVATRSCARRPVSDGGFRMKRWIVIVVTPLLMVGCNGGAETFTLYRNSNLDRSMRVHWATFDASESDRNYNRHNCEMAARLLNANMGASAEAEGMPPPVGVGFWCEPGSYSEKGTVPFTFPAAFPTDI